MFSRICHFLQNRHFSGARARFNISLEISLTSLENYFLILYSHNIRLFHQNRHFKKGPLWASPLKFSPNSSFSPYSPFCQHFSRGPLGYLIRIFIKPLANFPQINIIFGIIASFVKIATFQGAPFGNYIRIFDKPLANFHRIPHVRQNRLFSRGPFKHHIGILIKPLANFR